MLIRTTNNAYSALPDTTSMGSQEKWVVGDRFYKLDPISGFDSLAEATVSELESYIDDIKYVDYFLDFPKTIEGEKRRVCYSYNCVPKGYSEITLYQLLLKYTDDIGKLNKYIGKDFVLKCSEVVQESINFDPMNYFSKLIYLDSLTLNEDRHLNNISFLVNKSGRGKDMPILDNGKALLSDLSVYPLERNTLSCIRRVKSKPFSTSFKKQVSYFNKLYPPLVINYEKLNEKFEEVYKSSEVYAFNTSVASKVLRRMISVLKQNMRDQEGITWVRK